MGFGFAKSDEEETKDSRPNIPHQLSDKINYHKWEDLYIGMKVKSLLTGTEGLILGLFDKWKQVDIEWDNGKASFYTQDNLENVIVIKDKTT